MLIECVLIGSSLCQAANKPAKAEMLPRKQNFIVAVFKDRPVVTLAAIDVTAKVMD
jgi:hypothetical protein